MQPGSPVVGALKALNIGRLYCPYATHRSRPHAIHAAHAVVGSGSDRNGRTTCRVRALGHRRSHRGAGRARRAAVVPGRRLRLALCLLHQAAPPVRVGGVPSHHGRARGGALSPDWRGRTSRWPWRRSHQSNRCGRARGTRARLPPERVDRATPSGQADAHVIAYRAESEMAGLLRTADARTDETRALLREILGLLRTCRAADRFDRHTRRRYFTLLHERRTNLRRPRSRRWSRRGGGERDLSATAQASVVGGDSVNPEPRHKGKWLRSNAQGSRRAGRTLSTPRSLTR